MDPKNTPLPAVIEADDRLMAALATRWRMMTAGAGPFRFQPARLAMEARTIQAGGAHELPIDAVTRIWRCFCGEVMAAQGLQAVYVAGGDIAETIEAARGYFGFGPNLVQVPEVREALDRADEAGALACVPWPEIPGPGSWWPMLNENRFRDLRVLAGWPQLPGEPQIEPRVAIVGRWPIEESGDDDMLATAHDDRHAAENILGRAGLAASVAARARSLTLIRIQGFTPNDDPRLDAARRAGLDGLRIVGVLPRA
jgi:hypothetical protein